MRNLFDVDVEAVGRLVREANAGLAQRCADLVAVFDQMPPALDSDDAVRRAEAFARQIKAAISEVRKAKMQDKAPFARAEKVLDTYFTEMSKPLQKAANGVDSALNVARNHAKSRDRSASAVTPIAAGAGAQVVMTAVEPDPPGLISAEVTAQLPTVWRAEFIDRAALDLEALRDLMTDAEMDRLVARWLKENGPKRLRGVRWTEVVKT